MKKMMCRDLGGPEEQKKMFAEFEEKYNEAPEM